MALSERQNFGIYPGQLLTTGSTYFTVFRNDGQTGLVLRKILGNFALAGITTSTAADVAVVVVLAPYPLNSSTPPYLNTLSYTSGDSVYTDPKNILWSGVYHIKNIYNNILAPVEVYPGRSLHSGYSTGTAQQGDAIICAWKVSTDNLVRMAGVLDLFLGEES